MQDQWELSLQGHKMANKYQTDQFEFVNDLLLRQDNALAQLDLLDAKVDQTIKEMLGNKPLQFNPADPDCQTSGSPRTVADP